MATTPRLTTAGVRVWIINPGRPYKANSFTEKECRIRLGHAVAQIMADVSFLECRAHHFPLKWSWRRGTERSWACWSNNVHLNRLENKPAFLNLRSSLERWYSSSSEAFVSSLSFASTPPCVMHSEMLFCSAGAIELLYTSCQLDDDDNNHLPTAVCVTATGTRPNQPVPVQPASVHGRAGTGEPPQALRTGHLHPHPPRRARHESRRRLRQVSRSTRHVDRP